MLNRLVSNVVLGFFVVVLVVVYGISKQAPAYQAHQDEVNRRKQAATTETGDTKADTAQPLTVAGVQSALKDGGVALVSPAGKKIQARVADTQAERERGLSGTAKLGDEEGMLFVFEEAGDYGVWMKEMEYDLDIIWLDGQGKVVSVAPQVKAPTADGGKDLPVYRSQEPAMYVLELPAGKASELGIVEGAMVSLS